MNTPAAFAVGVAAGDRRRSLVVVAAVPLNPNLEVVPVFFLCDAAAAAAAAAAVRCKTHRSTVGAVSVVSVVAVGHLAVGAVAIHLSLVVVQLAPSFP